MKQSAMAQGIKAPQTAATQPMPQPAATVLAEGPASDTMTTQSIAKATAQTPANGPLPLATEKIGSLALRTAAANGNPKAQFEVGMRFSEGRGVPQDMHEAVVWFERAAAQSFQPAAYRLGSAYEKGLGVDRNPIEAKRWYRTAAEGGNIRAMHNLGVLYANERDMPSALPWFQKAAEAGLKDSEFNLGIIYALGSGVKQDLAVSYKWFALGAAQGDQEAAKKRDDILTHLDHMLQASAKLAVSTWKPAPISRDANEETAVWSEPAATASAQPSAAPAAPPPPAGWTKVMQAQAALQGKGFYLGKIDGDLTPETKSAIRAFQRKAGLHPSGEIDPAFLNAVVAKQM
jgi:localization factor PodJL